MTREAAASMSLAAPHAGADETLLKEMRAYGRESTVAAIVLCLVGMVAVLALFLGRFRLSIDTRGGKPPSLQIIHDGNTTRIVPAQQPVDLTPGLVLAAMATLAASMVIFGGAMFHLKKLPPASAWALSITAFFSFAGFLLLLTNV